MAAEVASGALASVLRETAELLLDAGEKDASLGLEKLAALASGASDMRESQDVARRVLSLYTGMGSFQDLVLQDESGVRPEQNRLDRLRRRLFEVARKVLTSG